MTTFTFSVQGDPIPQGSKTVAMSKGRSYVRDDNPKLKPWRARVAKMAAVLWRTGDGQRPPLAGPVDVELWFYMPRRDGHYGSGRNAHRLKDDAPDFPIARQSGDLDKLARAALDALTTAAVLGDDVQVVDLHAYKRYADRTKPGVHVLVRSHPRTVVMAETLALQEVLL